MRNLKETYIVICKLHTEELQKYKMITTPELLSCLDCETPVTVGIRCYPRNKHNKLLDEN